MGMNILFVVSILVLLGVVGRWVWGYVRPGIVGKPDTHRGKTSAKLPPMPPTTDTVVATLPDVDVRPWLEGVSVPPLPSIDFGLLGLDEDREADEVAIWRIVRRVLATRRDAKGGTEKS